jgi:hypothetical protein
VAVSNPYQPPGSDEVFLAKDDDAMARIAEHMRGMRPWQLMFAILSALSVAFMVLAGVGVAIMAAVAPKPPFPAAIGLLYVILGGVYVIPTVTLFRCYASIDAFLGDPGLEGLERALDRQRVFWRAAGYMTIVIFVLYFFAIVGAVVFGVLGAIRA